MIILRKIIKTIKPLRILKMLIVLVCLYFIVDPFLPEIEYRIKKLFNINPPAMEIVENDNRDEEDSSEVLGYTDTIVKENRLYIPSIWVDVEIVEGSSDKVLSQGAWRRPNSSTPKKGSNTVVTAHRYQYTPPSNKTFYNLDKVEEGDSIVVYWEGDTYEYEVRDTFIVKPDQVEIEQATDEPILTLYTCHPLFTADKRLVVVAELID